MKVKIHEATFGEEEIDACVKVLRSKNVNSAEKVREFERKFGDNAVLCNSGSSANLLAISALTNPVLDNRLVRGDSVIVSALSWSTTVWPLVQHGLIPVIVDIDPETLNMDMDQALSYRRKGIGSRAVMPVHVYGNRCDLSALKEMQESGHFIIEDCCEAMGSEGVGSVGDVSTYSFYFSHHMTMMEGGLVVSKNKELNDLVRILRAHGWVRDLDDNSAYVAMHDDIDPRFLFVNAGYNLRATELQAAMGLVQLKKFPNFLSQRRYIGARLTEVFKEYSDILTTQKDNGGSSWFGFAIVVKDKAKVSAKELREKFEKNGIETRSIICGNIARQPGMRLWPHRIPYNLKNADHVMRNGFSIGCHQNMTDESVEYVAKVMKDSV